MSPSLSRSLRDLLADVRPAASDARSRLTDRRALARRSALLPAVLGALQAVGLVAGADWTARDVHRSDTGVAIVPIGPPDGPAQLMIKFADTGPALDALRAQQLRLAGLHADPRLAGWAAMAPRVLHAGLAEAIPYFVETALPGLPASRLVRDTQVRERLLPMAAELIADLQARSGTPGRVDDALLEDWVERPLRAVATTLERRGGAAGDGRDAHGALKMLGKELRTALAGRDVTIGWMHGDYWPGNILATPDGRRITGVIDWDLSSATQLGLHDPVLLIMMTRRLTTGLELGEIVGGLLTDAPLQPVERATFAAAGIQPPAWQRQRRETVLLAWLRFVGHFAPTDGTRPRWVRHNLVAVLEALPNRRPSRAEP